MIWIGGQEVCSGSYLLRIEVSRQLSLVFGRFRCGEPLQIESGTYAYVGSAMGRNGRAPLARRLLRHATRSPGNPAHPIRVEMLDSFRRHDMISVNAPILPLGKRLHWHIDYLLDEMAVDLVGVLAVRSGSRLEDKLADLLLAEPAVWPIARGLGASDAPGKTHLLKAPAGAIWWQILAGRVALMAQETRSEPVNVCVGDRQ